MLESSGPELDMLPKCQISQSHLGIKASQRKAVISRLSLGFNAENLLYLNTKNKDTKKENQFFTVILSFLLIEPFGSPDYKLD